MASEDNEARLKKLETMLRDARETNARLQDQLLAMVEVLAGTDPVRDVAAFWDTYWTAKYRTPYVWAYAKDRGNIKRLLKTMSVFDLKARIGAYMASTDPFNERNSHSFGVFVATINTWSGKPLPRPPGCKHTPACESDVAHTRKRAGEMVAPDQPF